MRRLLHVFSSLLLLALASSCRRPAPPAAEAADSAPSIASRLARDFSHVLVETEKLAATTSSLYASPATPSDAAARARYTFAPNGTFYKPVNDGGAALWISGAVPITPAVQAAAWLTEPLDTELKRLCHDLPIVAQAYYNDKNSLNRIYPWMDVLTQYEPRMDIPSFNFYYLADVAHNPSRRGVWVADPYVDPAGRGWMISAIAPVYHADSLQGVVGLDITLETILARYVESNSRPLAIVARSGVIVAATESAIALFEMPPLQNHKYLATVRHDTFKPDDYNLAKSRLRPVRALAASLAADSPAPSSNFELNGASLSVSAAPVPDLGWLVLVFSPR